MSPKTFKDVLIALLIGAALLLASMFLPIVYAEKTGYGLGYTKTTIQGVKSGSGCTITGIYTTQIQRDHPATDYRRCNVKDDTPPTLGRVLHVSNKICVELVDTVDIAEVQGFERFNYTNWFCHNPIVHIVIVKDSAGNVARLRI